MVASLEKYNSDINKLLLVHIDYGAFEVFDVRVFCRFDDEFAARHEIAADLIVERGDLQSLYCAES